MFKQSILFCSLLAMTPCGVLFAGSPASQDNQINLTVTRFDDHVKVECSPANADTSTRQDWKSLCNEMAAPQLRALELKGVIAPHSETIYDSAAIAEATET